MPASSVLAAETWLFTWIRQVLGQYKIKNVNLKPLYLEVMQKLAEFSSYSIAHIRLEKNSRADYLANQAIDDHLTNQ